MRKDQADKIEAEGHVFLPNYCFQHKQFFPFVQLLHTAPVSLQRNSHLLGGNSHLQEREWLVLYQSLKPTSCYSSMPLFLLVTLPALAALHPSVLKLCPEQGQQKPLTFSKVSYSMRCILFPLMSPNGCSLAGKALQCPSFWEHGALSICSPGFT